MLRPLASILYWFAAVVITLGAFGHGFVGVLPISEAIETSTLPPDVTQPIWIVWYWVSGSMITYGLLLFWAWPALKNGSSSRSVPVLIVGAFYLLAGVAAYMYSGRDPFWLMFVVLGVLAIGTTLVLGAPRKQTT
jgi:hypothetical protein